MDKIQEREEKAARLKAARMEAGHKTIASAPAVFGWKLETYKSHEYGRSSFSTVDGRKYAKAFGCDLAWLMLGEEPEESSEEWRVTVPIMGYIGLGSEIDPDMEQIPPEGLDQVEIPFTMPQQLIGFEMRGDSGLPYYEDGDVVVCFKDQRRPVSDYIGKEVAVRIGDGNRYLKRLKYGRRRGSYNLESSNARPIEDVKIEWLGEIVAIVKSEAVRR